MSISLCGQIDKVKVKYCYHLLDKISLTLSQSNHIMELKGAQFNLT